MVRLSSDQQQAIWAGVLIARAVLRGHAPEVDQEWRQIGVISPSARYLAFCHPDPAVATRVQRVVEIIVGAVEGAFQGLGPTAICIPKP